MAYVEGFVIPVPTAGKAAFTAFAEATDVLFLEVGARRMMECWQDEVPTGERTDFRKAVQATDDESVVFSWIEWPDKATRDQAMKDWEALAKTDERFAAAFGEMPFDGKRMLVGSFEPVVSFTQ